MKISQGFVGLSALLFVAADASADVTGITLRFGGGCTKSNISDGCVLRPRFSGFELDTETAVLYTCSTPQGGCRRYSPRIRLVSAAGEVYMRIKNIPGGCFEVRTGPNGNEKPDVRSRILCEK
jgi:hypothetical protein